MLSRNFYQKSQKSVIVNFCNFHTVQCEFPHCWKFNLILSWQKVRESNVLLNTLSNSWFDEIFFGERGVLQCHSVEKREIHCHANFFPSNQFIVKFFSKTLIWRNFCEKIVAVKFCNFHSVSVVHTYIGMYVITEIYTHTTLFGKNFV